jgi:uracil DNA glycosylase
VDIKIVIVGQDKAHGSQLKTGTSLLEVGVKVPESLPAFGGARSDQGSKQN